MPPLAPLFDAERGFGFEPGSNAEILGPAARGQLSRDAAVSAAAPPDSHARVLAEQRRLMLEDLSTDRAGPVERSFIVNIRTAGARRRCPRMPPVARRVALKPREIGSATWDDKLTLGISPVMRPLQFADASSPRIVPTLYLAGDSTVTDQAARAERELGPDAAAILRRRTSPSPTTPNRARR